MTDKDVLTHWLRDAYAMERGLEITLKKQAENAELSAAMRQRAEAHLEETRRHAEMVKHCLESLGSDVSAIKTGMGRVMETLKGMGTVFARDERVKDALAAYASEHFEIACYKALRVAARELGEHQVVAACDRIIPDEVRMADWLDENLPAVVTSYLHEAAAPA